MSGARSSTATGTTATAEPAGYVGRFAPTPSGDLHLGSLYTAAASYLDARSAGGRWLLRLEDVDRPRELPGAADRILRALAAFGFEWDGPVVRQSERAPLYAAALDELRAAGALFACSCSRRERADAERYPGTCRDGPQRPGPTALRLRVDPGFVEFDDRVQGRFRQDVAAQVGDFTVQRRDGIIAYALAVVVDDAEQGVTHVVRGADLLDSTPPQILLQRRLSLATPSYAHVPLIVAADGSKLAKTRGSEPLEWRAEDPCACARILAATCRRLGLSPPPDLQGEKIFEIWRWAIAAWSLKTVPRRLFFPWDPASQSPPPPLIT